MCRDCTNVVDFSFKYERETRARVKKNTRESVFLYIRRAVLRHLSFTVLVYPEITFRTKHTWAFLRTTARCVGGGSEEEKENVKRASERASEQSYGSTDDRAPSWSGLSVLHEVLRRTRARSLTEHDPDRVETFGPLSDNWKVPKKITWSLTSDLLFAVLIRQRW